MPSDDLKEKAAEGARKRPPFGPDIDLEGYAVAAKEKEEVQRLDELPPEVREQALRVGVDAAEDSRDGSFFQIDHSVLFSRSCRSGLEVLDIRAALECYGGLPELWWKALSPDADKYTARAELAPHHGYFVRALPGTRTEFPLQACLFLTTEGLAQNVHNIVVAEEGSELHLLTGCTTGGHIRSGLHIGVTEIYVRKGAHVTSTMIHSWGPEVNVRPRTAVVIEDDGVFLSNFICLRPAHSLQSDPVAWCLGENSVARFNTVLLAPEGSSLDVGGRIVLRGKGSRGELISKAITTGGEIVSRGHFLGEGGGAKGHMECRGLILSEKGRIHAIPELEGTRRELEMTHEAAVGKIAPEEIEYLMARGLTQEEATAAIVRGFLDIEIRGLPGSIREEIQKALREEVAAAF